MSADMTRKLTDYEAWAIQTYLHDSRVVCHEPVTVEHRPGEFAAIVWHGPFGVDMDLLDRPYSAVHAFALDVGPQIRDICFAVNR